MSSIETQNGIISGMLIAANWKAYVQSVDKARKLFALSKRLATQKGIDIALAVPAPYLALFAKGNRSKVAIGAQDVSLVTSGAKTGETSAALLADAGVTYVIVGHSERRAMGETDAIVAEKAQRVLANGLIPILCIGETSRDSDAQYLKALRAQISAVYAPLTLKERQQIVIAYEPIWAIGKTAADAITPHDLTEMVLYIRKIVGEYIIGKLAAKTKILYGGSAEPGNARILASGTHIDGFLVGHASVEPAAFSALVKSLA